MTVPYTMEGSQQPLSGFSDHIQGQLLEAARQVSNTQPDRGRGQHRRGRGQYHPYNQLHHHQTPLNHHQNFPNRSHNVNSQPWGNQPMADPTDLNSFPRLGATRPQPPAALRQQNQPAYSQTQPLQSGQHISPPTNYPLPATNQSPQYQRRDPFFRGRGNPHRGRGNHGFHNNQFQPSPQGQFQPQNPDEFHRPLPTQRKLFTPGTHSQFNSVEEQRAIQRRIMDQSDFLNHLANQSLKNQLTVEEQQAKERFRKELEIIAQRVITEARTEAMKFDPSHVQLKLYGSLGSGFGVAGSDMDLLLAFPQNEGPLGDIEIESRRMLEKGLLDAGIGARLLTNTRVPILRVCQCPNPELLKNLRECRLDWERSLTNPEPPPADEGFGPLPILTESQTVAAALALAELDLGAPEVPLPVSPPSEHAKLEFVGDCGIQCDINFTNYVALHNTRLLKTYGKCDSRVRQVGVFVKSWAKARDINTPYRGTLSSYGYVLMVLHYLMSVVTPPVIPNLQEIAKHRDSFEDQANIELVEGFDVRFVRDMDDVQSIMKDMPRNHESVGSLLRGFFQYYADPKGFHWQQDVISIRSRSGRLTKRSKGWTEAKWAESNQNVRLRYLLAIEDPFELEHNVGRTVGHSGIVAIRDEFRRAWSIIEKIQFDNKDRAWFWLDQESQPVHGTDLMSVIDNRGDLLRKDQDFHRQKARQMRQELEAKEKALQLAATQGEGSVENMRLNGTSEMKVHNNIYELQMHSASTPSTVVNNGTSQIKRHRQKVSNRRAIQEDDDEDDDEENLQVNQTIKTAEIDWSKPFCETEISINPEWTTRAAEIDWGKPFGETEISMNPEWTSSVNNNALDQGNSLQPQSSQLEIQEDWDRADANDSSQAFVNGPQTSMSELQDDEWTSEQGSNTQKPHQELDQGPVKVMIAWNNQSNAGRWLRWRDRRIQAGKWHGASDRKFQKLDKDFPYDPHMTVMELAVKNRELETLHKSTCHPKNQIAQKDKLPEGEQSKLGGTTSLVSNQDDVNPTNTKASIDTQAKERRGTDRAKSKIQKNSRSQRPYQRSRRTYPRPADDPNSEAANDVFDASTGDNQLRLPTQVSHHPAQPGAGDETRSSRRPEHVQPSQIPTENASRTATQPRASVLTKPSKFNHPMNQTVQPPIPSEPPPLLTSEPQSLVPLPLHPNSPAHHRPRDEDPNIMPIPRKLNFQFDLRQLADLDVIRRGGNGCARYLEEFDIEVDYEFGGGGVMATKSSSTTWHAGGKRSHGDGNEKIGPGWEARGDEEGLLDELPRNVDI